jgi:hypothetical protein
MILNFFFYLCWFAVLHIVSKVFVPNLKNQNNLFLADEGECSRIIKQIIIAGHFFIYRTGTKLMMMMNLMYRYLFAGTGIEKIRNKNIIKYYS